MKSLRNPNITARPAGSSGSGQKAHAIQAHTMGRGTPQGANPRSVSPINTKPPSYTVQAPVRVAGHGQQIKATISGTPRVAGSVELSTAGAGKVYLSNLKVDHQHRRQGVAAKLIDAAVATARRQGFRAATLEARPSDHSISAQALVAMYRRQGFKSIGKSKRGSPLMERKL